MKKFTLSLLCFLVLGISISNAQFAKIYDFTTENDLINVGESQPVYDGTWLYDVTYYGGANGFGCIFKVKPDGTDYSKLLDFNGTSNGSYPKGSLTLSGSTLYGATSGAIGYGTIYKISTDGTGYVKLMDFNGTNGGGSNGSLAISGTALYGMTYGGGISDNGTIFRVNTDGTGYTKLLDFDGTLKGRSPYGSVIISGSVLYGMTEFGGSNDNGTAFRINSDGTGFTKLLDFAGTTNGKYPYGSLIISGSDLFGMTSQGGAYDYGTVFKISTDGTVYTKLLDFDGYLKGFGPHGNLTISGSVLYGMTSGGGSHSIGTSFKINTDGTGYAKLLDFDGAAKGRFPSGSLTLLGSALFGSTQQGGISNRGVMFKINTDGSAFTKILEYSKTLNGCNPNDLILFGSVLYGTTNYGGANGSGTIIKINTDGTGFTKIFDLEASVNISNRRSSLIISGSVLYGMTSDGGSFSCGTIFKINVDGTGYAKLFEFDRATNGGSPNGSLLLSGSYLYGMTQYGGTNDRGTIFKIHTDGTGYCKLLDFNGTTNGGYPSGSLTLSGSTLYGMTCIGGANAFGTIFKISTDGTGYCKLLDFNGTINGSYPKGSLTISDLVMFGMTSGGGINSKGTIFRINTDGSEFTKLLDFDGLTTGESTSGSLVLSNSILYGVADLSGTYNKGVLFKINSDGTGFTKLQDFNRINGEYPSFNSLVLGANALFGVTPSGGSMHAGVIFKFDLIPPAVPTIGTITQPTCTLATGSVVLEGLPASGEWTLTRSPGGTTTTGTGTSTTISGLVVGTYTFTVTNASILTSTASADVVINVQPTTPSAPTLGIITQPTCLEATGSTVLNGLPASGTWTLIRTPGGTITTGTGTSTTIAGLAPGTFNYTVTNASGCTSPASANVVINAQQVTPTAPAVGTITQPTCAVATGSVTLDGLPATGTWTLTRTPGGTTSTGTGTTSTVSGLAAGTYTYTVTNASGCTSPASANVVINAQPVTPTAPAVGTITQPTCAVATGSVTLDGLSATGTWTLTRTPGGTIGTGTGTTSTVSGLATGTYTYTVTNASGCTSPASANVVINAQPVTPTAPAVGAITQPTIAVATGSVVLNDLPTTDIWTLIRIPGTVTSSGMGTNSTITGLATGTYTFTVTNASGCTSAASANIVINAQPTSGINDGNSQAINYLGQNYPNPFDLFTTIEFSIVKPSQVTLSVYNTLGKEVGVIVNEFLANGSYTRNWEPKNLPNGIYYYQLRIEGFKATRRLIILE